MTEIIKFNLLLIVFITLIGCNSDSHVVLYLSNVNEKVDVVEFEVKLDNIEKYNDSIRYKKITPSYEEIYFSASKGEHKLSIMVNGIEKDIVFDLVNNSFFYVSFIDSLGFSKIAVLNSEIPFQLQ